MYLKIVYKCVCYELSLIKRLVGAIDAKLKFYLSCVLKICTLHSSATPCLLSVWHSLS